VSIRYRATRLLASLASLAFVTLVALFTTAPAHSAEEVVADVLDLDATVTADVVPDFAVITMVVVRAGPDVAPLTSDVNRVLAKAFADAKAVPAVLAASGGYSTSPHYEMRNNQNVRSGWEVQAQVILKSKDIDALGALVGRLSQSLQIASSGFEVSPDLRARTSAALIDQGARAFQDKATATARALGYAGYSIRHVTVGEAGQAPGPRPMFKLAQMAARAAEPLPIEAGPVTLSLTFSGSLQMRH
jgi:predicted secreted protein